MKLPRHRRPGCPECGFEDCCCDEWDDEAIEGPDEYDADELGLDPEDDDDA